MSARTSLRFSPIIAWGGVALTALFGMQILRTTFAQLLYLLRDRLGWSAPQLGILAIVIFLSAFLAALVRRLLTPRWALLATGAGVGLVRLLIQVWTGDPLGDLILGLLGTVLFTLFLPMALARGRAHGVGSFVLGLLLGLAVDVALHGAYGTYDAAWRSGLGTLLLVIALVLVQGGLVWATSRTAPVGASDSRKGLSLTWLAIGPFLFLEMLIFQNLAALNAQTGWSMPAGFAWALFSHAAGLAAAAIVLSLPRRSRWPVAVLGGVLLVIATLLPPARNTPLAGVTMLIGQAGLAALLTVVLSGLEVGAQGEGLGRITVAHGIGMLLFTLFIFVYYASMDMRLPFSADLLPPVAAGLVTLCAVGASLPRGEEPAVVPGRWLPAGAGVLLLVMPLVMVFSWKAPAPALGSGYPVRVMDYNLHGGFDCQGHLDLEALARTIERENPDVVGLQEVSRGWVINGSADMLLWLAHRLGMPYVWAPTVDLVWGNAILSRYPVLSVEEHVLPPPNLLMGRGFVVAQIGLGNGQTLQMIDTHFHHVPRDQDVRMEQSQRLLAYWSGAAGTVITGDLNAKPDEAEIVLFYEAGLLEACSLAGITPCFTDRADNLVKKIDYLWLSPDLTASQVVVPASTASDHLPLVATVGR